MPLTNVLSTQNSDTIEQEEIGKIKGQVVEKEPGEKRLRCGEQSE